MAINLWPQNATASLYKIKSCEGSGLQNGGLFILLVSLTADSTTTCFNKYKDYFDIPNLYFRHPRPDWGSPP